MGNITYNDLQRAAKLTGQCIGKQSCSGLQRLTLTRRAEASNMWLTACIKDEVIAFKSNLVKEKNHLFEEHGIPWPGLEHTDTGLVL